MLEKVMILSLRKLLSLLLMTTFFLVGFGEQAHAVVLCFGADGHEAFEAESGGRCAPSYPTEHSAVIEVQPVKGNPVIEEATIDPCLDYCLSVIGESVRKNIDLLNLSNLQNLLPIGIATISPSVHPVMGVLHPKLSLSDIPPPYKAAIALRTIVLLI